jgi:hypothetical protein
LTFIIERGQCVEEIDNSEGLARLLGYPSPEGSLTTSGIAPKCFKKNWKTGTQSTYKMRPLVMNTRINISVFYVAAAVLIGLCPVSMAAKKPEPLTQQGENILATYTTTLDTLRKEIVASLPKIDEKKSAAYFAAHGEIAKLPTLPNPNDLKMAPVTFCAGNPAYEEAQANALLAARAVLNEVKPFLKGDEMHAKLAKCALLTIGAHEMAAYASLGDEEKSYVDMLLSDDKLIVDVMELGGAYENKYGQSIRNYKAIQKASKNAVDKEFFRLWALASSLEHPDGSHVPEGKTAPEAMVEFFLSYEKAYLNGELDPAFPTLTAWDCRFLFAFKPLESMTWMRKMIRNYRPDHMKLDYKWRYCRITKSDVPYTSNASGARAVGRKKHNLSAMQSYFLVGGICGPRAFTGRAATHAFGIPSRPAPQTGHAAMSHWTPDGWVTVFGAHWTHNHFRGQCGLDFELESRARSRPDEYHLVHRANWLGDALAEPIVARKQFGVGGGFWKSLAHYKKLAIVQDADLKALAAVGSEFAESNEAAISPNSDWIEEEDGPLKKVEKEFPQVELTEIDKTITTDANGVITIPVAACSKPVSTEKIRFMKSHDDKFVQLHYNLAGNRPELRSYTLNIPEAGQYNFTAKVVSVTLDRSFTIRANRRNMHEVDVPFTLGDWMETKPVTMDLKEGRNKLQLTVKSPNKGVSIRSFTLTPIK